MVKCNETATSLPQKHAMNKPAARFSAFAVRHIRKVEMHACRLIPAQ